MIRNCPYILSFKSRLWMIPLWLTLAHCGGTIIGNGLKPDDDDPKETAAGPDVQNSEGPAPSMVVDNHLSALDLILSSCANPFAHSTSSELQYQFSYAGSVKNLVFTKSSGLISAVLDSSVVVVFSEDSSGDWQSIREADYPEKGVYTCDSVSTPTNVDGQGVLEEYGVSIHAFEKDYQLTWRVTTGTLDPVQSFKLVIEGESIEIFGSRVP